MNKTKLYLPILLHKFYSLSWMLIVDTHRLTPVVISVIFDNERLVN